MNDSDFKEAPLAFNSMECFHLHFLRINSFTEIQIETENSNLAGISN